MRPADETPMPLKTLLLQLRLLPPLKSHSK